MQNAILYIDLEVNRKTKKIDEIGLLCGDEELRTSNFLEAQEFIKCVDAKYLCGHNVIDFDLGYLKTSSLYRFVQNLEIIDTLPLSLLLFNEKTHHSLPKNYKSEDDFKNNPLEDAKITKHLFMRIEVKFVELKKRMQYLFYSLLYTQEHFQGFFKYIFETIPMETIHIDGLINLIEQEYNERIVNTKYLRTMVQKHPVELAYILALLTPHIEIKAHPPKILYTFPDIVQMQKKLCFEIDDARKKLADFSQDVFGFGTFREFPKLNAGLFDSKTLSQREMVEASLRDENFLCILPTGGGKTFTFWLPALYKAEAYKSLTVVISPLQALIEDHIKSFNAQVANYKAVAISGFLSPLERAEAIESVVNGEADILYIAPESLRSEMLFRVLKNRLIERFVIDEVHCLSTWGNDFRQDYFYICEYIKELVEAKNFQESIPVSCFTATAKPGVIEDIQNYFYDGLEIQLGEYFAVPERTNLTYHAIEANGKDKYTQLLAILKEHTGPTLIYIPSSTRECDAVAERLEADTDRKVNSFHSKIESQEKMQILQDYINNKIDIIVATTAFGMGVDKPDIMNVIHYEVSSSLEDYAQEAGRGARDKSLNAFCPILFDEDDLDKHFNQLNRSKITTHEINSILSVLKRNKGDVVTKTAFELAKEAGWDVEGEDDYATKIKTILLELEREGYIVRKRNKTSFFADSVISQSMQHLHKVLEQGNYAQEEKEQLILVLQTITGRGKVGAVQIDELAYLLGLEKHDIALRINQLKEFGILGNAKDLSLQINRRSRNKFKNIARIELHLLGYMQQVYGEQVLMRNLNEHLCQIENSSQNNIPLITTIIKNWREKSHFIFKRINREKDLWYFKFENFDAIAKKITLRQKVAEQLLEILTKQMQTNGNEVVEFSLKDLYDKLGKKVTMKEIDKTLLYLHHLGIVELLYGRFINYSPMKIHKDKKASGAKRFTKQEYNNRLAKHYNLKTEAIHIMGEYAKRLERDAKKAVKFLKDYFTMPYQEFKKRYDLTQNQITQPMSKKRYRKLFEKLSEKQKEIINDIQTKAMMILAGPGSGKTKVLVHKIASLILREDIKPSQFMMLTFSKSAKWEFKTRLSELIGPLSFEIEVQTFHAFSLNIVGREVKSDDDTQLHSAIKDATCYIQEGSVKLRNLAVLVLDEYQDVNEESFALIEAIYNANEKAMRIIAVGDDDQCIMEHIGSDVKFIERFVERFSTTHEQEQSVKQYQLTENFRSDIDIVAYTNYVASTIKQRYKTDNLYAHSNNNGEVKIHYFPNSDSLVPPLLEKIKNAEQTQKSIALLTFTNEEVMQIYALALEYNLDVKYLIEREKFKLKDVIEVVEFCYKLDSHLTDVNEFKKEHFEQAFQEVKSIYSGSKNLKLLEKIVNRFLDEHSVYYVSQWDTYLDEITLEDFESYQKKIVVSTIHKAKGMEFDTVYLLVNQPIRDDDTKRLYYVGMTRAKHRLYLLVKGLSKLYEPDYVEMFQDSKPYKLQNKLYVYEMSLKDLWLNYDVDQLETNLPLFASTSVTIRKTNFYNHSLVIDNTTIGVFSKSFDKEYSAKLQEGYELQYAQIQYTVVWFSKQKGKNLRHPLCKIVMQKSSSK